MPFTYTAPNPYPPTLWESFLNLFPSSSSLSSSSDFSSLSSSSESIGGMILPAQERRNIDVSAFELSQLETGYDLTIERGNVETHDKVTLDTIALTSNQENSHRYIIKFNGNGGLYQDLLDEYAEDAKTLNATVIGFNYRGVGASTRAPYKYQDLVTDGIAQVNRLLSQGVRSEDILLDGISLGGSVAVMVAKYFHDKKQPVYVWNDRSLSSLAKAAGGMLANLIAPSLEGCLATSSYSVLKPTGWQVDVASAYKKIPATHKGYMVVDKDSANGIGDGVISQKASLHEGVKQFEKQTGKSTQHTAYHFFSAGHNQTRRALQSVEERGQTAQDIFEDFVTTHMPTGSK